MIKLTWCEDYERLLSVDENEDLEPQQEEDNDEIINLQKELKSFITSIGLVKDETIKVESTLENLPNNQAEIKIIDNAANFKHLSETLSGHNHVSCLLKDCIPWFEQVVQLPREASSYNQIEIDSIHELAKNCWQKEVELYQAAKDRNRSSDANWLRTVLKSGTQSDKVAALTMITQESPLHCMRSLDALMNMTKKKGRREALIAVDSLRHLWVADILPDTKLRSFSQYPIEDIKNLTKDGRKDSQIRLLMTIAFEHELKHTYSDFVDTIQELSKDPLVNIRNKILGIIYELLVMKPEQEQKLLTMLVNKLGDPDRKVASKTSYLLSQLIVKHPNMKSIIIQEVERMIFRPNVSEKAQYYAICFLNQTTLSHQEKNVASKLISIYFSFFKVIAKQQKKKNIIDTQQTKLLSGLLTGVNRAFPYAGGEEENYDEQLNTLFRLTHIKHLSTSIQAFMLIYQVMESRPSVSNRYYQALYEKLLDPDIKSASRHTLLLNLLFKSLKNDSALKRVKSFMKRLIQIASPEQPSFLCGVLFLLSEVIKLKPGMKSMMEQAEEEDEEEHFQDVVLSDDDEKSDTEAESVDKSETKGHGASWTFLENDIKNKSYNMTCRNPLYAGAEFTCTWEILPLLSHFHPSVEHFARSVLKGEHIEYKGDPLQDFTLMRFLDRFMYRNPKKNTSEHGGSLMQPSEQSQRLKEQPVNSKIFLQKPEEDIRQDELFFYRYFKQKQATEKKVKKDDDDEETEEDGLDEENMYDFDFASEMKKNKHLKSINKDGGESSDDENSGDDVKSEDGSFDYDDMDNESEDEDLDDIPHGKNNFSDKDYEEALFENLNSDGESINGDETADGANGLDSMFAAADEFAHLLEQETDDVRVDGVHPKQRKWEQRHDQKKPWKGKKGFDKNSSNHGKRKQNFQTNIKKKKFKK